MTRDAGDNSGGIGSQSGGGSSGGGISVDSGSRGISTPRWLGKRIGRFKLMALLGQGAMGRVFRAEDTLMGRHVALKLLPKSYKKGGVSVGPEMLINEARAAAAIEHPNAVQIYEVNQAGDVCYVAMELLEGGSLRDLVRAAGPMDLTRACLLCAEAAEALAAAHAAGVIHRDVKPANLMLSRQGRCKVVDFGLARLEGAGDWGSSSESVGTPQFIAPEILNGVPASDQSDVYSLGGTLWYLLTGSAPYQAKSARELLRMHMESPVPDLRSIRPEAPAGLADAMRTALAKRPQERFASMEQFARILRVNAIPIAASAESLGLAGPLPSAEALLEEAPHPDDSVEHGDAPKLEPLHAETDDEPQVLYARPAPSSGSSWPLLVGGGVVIAAVVAVLCIALLGPAKNAAAPVRDSSSAQAPAIVAVKNVPPPVKPAANLPVEVLPTSLVARWTSDDYESGNNWLDQVRHVAAVQNNSPVAVPNAFNGHPGIRLNGTNQYFVLNESDDPVPSARKMTLAVVFKPNIPQKSGADFFQGGGLIGGHVSDTADDFGMAWGGDSGTQVVAGAGDLQDKHDAKVSSPDLDLNRAHVAIMVLDCHDSSDNQPAITLYVDGARADQFSGSSGPRSANIAIALGAASANGSMPFSGMLAEVRIYNDSNLDVAALSDSLMRTYMDPSERNVNPLDPNGLLKR